MEQKEAMKLFQQDRKQYAASNRYKNIKVMLHSSQTQKKYSLIYNDYKNSYEVQDSNTGL